MVTHLQVIHSIHMGRGALPHTVRMQICSTGVVGDLQATGCSTA